MGEESITVMTLSELTGHVKSMPEDEILRITFEEGKEHDGREHETKAV